MDEIDTALVAALEGDVRNSYASLARRLHLSPSMVRRRMKSLLQEGVLHIIAAVDPAKVGMECSAFIGLDVDLACIDTVVETLAEDDNVRFAAFATGRFDVLIVVDLPSQKELAAFISGQLSVIEGIRQTETFLLLDVRKALHRRDLWGREVRSLSERAAAPHKSK